MPIRVHPFARIAIALVIAFGLTARVLMLVLAQDATPVAVDPPPPPADVTAPAISQPGDLYAAAADASGAVVGFDTPGATDDVDGPVGVSCAPVSGSLFPVGTTYVTCGAVDSSGNSSAVSFAITVGDQSGPSITQPADVSAATDDPNGAVVTFAVPDASDSIDGAVAVWCDHDSGALYPVGATVVTCSAQDSAGNTAAVVFNVIVSLNGPPTDPTEEPTDQPTDVPVDGTPEAGVTETPTTTDPGDTTTPPAQATDTPVENTPAPTATPTVPAAISEATDDGDADPGTRNMPATTPVVTLPTQEPTPEATPVRDALELPWPPPDSFVIVTDGGPLGGLAAIWNNTEDFPISQEFGHTDFSVSHPSWYAYGADYGLDGYEHPGIDIGMPAGTPLYSPIEGTVKIAGGVPFYTFYGNGQLGVGELLIEADNGDQVILGHMGRITVSAGDRVVAGQFVGLSGGDNGDHLHLEVREGTEQTGYTIVDPRKSFLIPAIAAADTSVAEQSKPNDGDSHRRYEANASDTLDDPSVDTTLTGSLPSDPVSTGASD